jgi:hypothetical protein
VELSRRLLKTFLKSEQSDTPTILLTHDPFMLLAPAVLEWVEHLILSIVVSHVHVEL